MEKELEAIWTNRTKSEKVTQWIDEIKPKLDNMNCYRAYLPGELNTIADAGSRLTIPKQDEQPQSIPEYISDFIEKMFSRLIVLQIPTKIHTFPKNIFIIEP